VLCTVNIRIKGDGMGLYDREYMRSRGNSGRGPEWTGNKVSGRNRIVVVIAIIMILVFVIAYLI